ncbi:MAG: hypothetical protein NHG36_04705 [Chromatiaceae bacterium]|nr:hypothetical protein [Candidatus Thioaporhodococcus sediminis]
MNALFLSPATAVVNVLMPTLMSLIPDDLMQVALDKLLDAIEDGIATSETKVDDALVLPLITALRHKLNVPDND